MVMMMMILIRMMLCDDDYGNYGDDDDDDNNCLGAGHRGSFCKDTRRAWMCRQIKRGNNHHYHHQHQIITGPRMALARLGLCGSSGCYRFNG